MIVLELSTVKKHKISPYLYMQFMEPLGVCDSSVDMAWDFVENDWKPNVMDKVTELAPTMVRFGGCFASYYHWKEAIGDINQRTPMVNYCWGGIYPNQVGTHEFIDFCNRVKAEPYLVVNMESDGRKHWSHPKNGTVRLGTADEAAEWVAYCNHEDNALRIKNGIKTPYNVKYWQIGNETSYDERGFSSDDAVEVTKRFADKIRQADSSVNLTGWGDYGQKDDTWCSKMSKIDEIDMIAFHHHFSSGLPEAPFCGTDYRTDIENTWCHLLNAHKSMQVHIDKMRADCGSKRLAMTECHFGLGGRNRNEVLSSWGAGVAYALCHNVIMRNSDILDIATMADFFGNVWQVNAILIPTHDPVSGYGKPYLQPVGSVMSLFRHHQGEYAADVSFDGDIDVTSSITGNTIFLHMANTSKDTSRGIRLDLGDKIIKKVKMYYIAAKPDVEITPDNIDVFSVKTTETEGDIIILPPAAVAAVEVEFETNQTNK